MAKGIPLSLTMLDRCFKDHVKPVTVQRGLVAQTIGYKLDLPSADVKLPKFKRRRKERRK